MKNTNEVKIEKLMQLVRDSYSEGWNDCAELRSRSWADSEACVSLREIKK